MIPALRKLALTAHVVSSVGWLGAVAAFLALAIAGLTNDDTQIVRAAYIASDTITWSAIVPLSFAALVTGIIQSLSTPWGVFRHYWVVAKLVIAVFATMLLLLHTRPIDRVARAAAERVLASGDLRNLRMQLIFDAAAAVVALLVATALSVYKPWGLLPSGPRWKMVSAIIVFVVLLLFVLRHLTRGGMGLH